MFVSTPYQVFVCIHLKNTIFENDNCDIYILDHFLDAGKISNNLKNLQIFKNVVVLESLEFEKYATKNILKGYIQKFIKLLFSNVYVQREINGHSLLYDKVLFSYPSFLIRVFIKTFLKINSKLKIGLFEDGTGGYSLGFLNNNSRLGKVIQYLTRSEEAFNRVDEIYLFQPELLDNICNLPTNKIPTINSNEVDLLNSTFSFDVNEHIHQKFIYFDNFFVNEEEFNKAILSVLQNIINLINDELIIKPHPRRQNLNDFKLKMYKNFQIPWEIIAMNSSIENKVLISYYSTALTSNKVIFDKEPILVFLFGLEELKPYYNESIGAVEYVEKIRKIYINSERIYVPQNLRELESILIKLKHC